MNEIKHIPGDRRAEPGFWPTLRAAVEAHPRLARAIIITWALALIWSATL